MQTEKTQKEAFLDALLETTSDCIYFKDRESRFLRISRKQMALFNLKNPKMNFGDDPSNAIGKTDFTFFSHEHAQQAFADEQEIMQSGQPKEKEEEEKWPDGSITYVLTKKYCLRDNEGNVIGTFGISRDITHRKNSETMLLDTQNELRKAHHLLGVNFSRASDIARLGFWEWDIYEDKMTATDHVYKIFNFAVQQKEVKLRDLQRLVHPHDLHIWNYNFSKAITANHFAVYQIRLKFPDESIKFLEVKADVGESDEYDLPTKLVGYVQDVTDRKHNEMRTQGLELAIRSFMHMIPGMAGEALNSLDNESKKAWHFMFMVKHKSDEVRSLLKEEKISQTYCLRDIFDKSWPIATDLIKINRDDLTVIYGNGTGEETLINAAFYTAAVNIFSNARQHGGPPYVIWTFVDGNQFRAIIGDGGRAILEYENKKSLSKDKGVGLPLVEKILSVVNGQVEQLTHDGFYAEFDNAPIELKKCRTFFHVTILL